MWKKNLTVIESNPRLKQALTIQIYGVDMKHPWKLLLLGFACLILPGCKDEDDALNYVFPLQIGNYWNMVREISTMFEGEGVYTDTLYMWVDQTATSPQGESCYRIKYRYSEADQDDYGYEFLVNRKEGLYLLGYINGGEGLVPFKAGQLCSGVFSRGLPQTRSKEITWLTTPRMIIPRNCTEGKTWGYPGIDDYLPVNYYIEARERITTSCGAWSCHTRRSAITEDDPDGWENHDYFSGPGLVKFLFEGIQEQYDMFGNLIGTYPFFERLLLQSYELN